MIALTELTHIFARDMVRRQTGHVLLVGSLLGYQATPGYAAYAVAKAYVVLLGEALHAELKKTGIGVTVVSPGPTSTSFADVAGQRDNTFLSMLMMKPQPVAKAGVRAMLRRKTSVVAGLINKAIVFVFRFTPRTIQGMIMQRVLSALACEMVTEGAFSRHGKFCEGVRRANWPVIFGNPEARGKGVPLWFSTEAHS